MISSVRGTVVHIEQDAVVVEVGGVGLTVSVTPQVARAAHLGEPLLLHTNLIVREDALSLFGFEDREELVVFTQLLGVTGVGPKSALGVLSTLTVSQIADAVGYHYAYDPEIDQYAHPAVVYVLAADGRVTRTLTALGLDPADLRLALVEAGHGRVGTFTDHLRLLCYGFDASTGAYTLTIRKWLMMAGVLTIVVVAGGIGSMLMWRRRAAPVYPPKTAPSEPV